MCLEVFWIVVSVIQKFVTCQVIDQDLNVASVQRRPPLSSDGSIRLSKYHHALPIQYPYRPQFIISVTPSSFPPYNLASLYADFEQDVNMSESSSDLEPSPMPLTSPIVPFLP